MRTRVCAFLLALAVSAVPALGAVTTTRYVLTNAGWTDLGAGPILLSFQGRGVFAIGDTTPSLTGEGFGIRPGRSLPIKTTSHVWVMAPGASTVNAYVASINTGVGSGCAAATNYLARTVGGNEGGNGAPITTLICGLVADGVWASLDTLHIGAQQNQADANLNLLSTSYPLGVVGGSPGWVAYQGYAPGGGFWADTFVPSTSPSPKFILNSASFGVWLYSAPPVGSFQPISANFSSIYTNYPSTPNLTIANINSGTQFNSNAPGALGLYVVDRASSTNATNYYNGVNQGGGASTATAVENSAFVLVGGGPIISETHVGASLGPTLNLALYNRLRAYMTAVGVP